MRNSISLFGAAALVATATGCGGSGGSGAASATELAFSVAWEQQLPAAASMANASSSPDGAALGFDTPIPPSVNAIRFILRPASGDDCCIAVLRDSQAFLDRHIVLADVPEGSSTLEVNGYPTDFAPADGVTSTCATNPAGQGVPCTSSATLPSFGSDQIPVDVVHGQRTLVHVDVVSLPFLLDLNPDDGQTADSARPRVTFTVVDANHDINPDIGIQLHDPPVTVGADILSSEPCRDGDGELPDCSESGQLEVRGLRITARSPQELPAGTADLRIQASNTATPPRDMESDTTFLVSGTVTSTTTTTGEITTTTLGEMQTFCLKFSVGNAVDLVGISYDVNYAGTGGDFTGSGENVSCVSLVQTNPDNTLLATFNDNDAADKLSTAIISADTFSGPTPLARCEFRQPAPLVLDNLAIQVTEATAPDLSPANATVVVEETPCPR